MTREIYTVCNAGKERSRGLASALDSQYRARGDEVSVVARGSFGLGADDDKNSLSVKYGWVPPEGFVDVMRRGGLEFHTYESKLLTEEEAGRAEKIIAVDPLVARRVREAYPAYAEKVINPLEVLADKQNPFPEYLGGNSIPDAYCGHLANSVRLALHSSRDGKERTRAVESVLERELDESELDFTQNYNPYNPTDPNAVMQIPKGFRDYIGHELDSDEAYLAEARVLSTIASDLLSGGHLD